MAIERVKKGERLKASTVNELIDATNDSAREPREVPEQGCWLGLFELTGAVTFPDLSTATTDHLNQEPTPYAAARLLFRWQQSAADTAAGSPIRSYAVWGKTEYVWFPTAARNAYGYALPLPTATTGTRVFCWFNEQSGRWEVLAPAQDVVRFELSQAFAPHVNCNSYATAYLLRLVDGLWAVDTNVTFTVYDTSGLRRGWAKTETRLGSRGYARYMPDTGHWEIVDMQHQARWVSFTVTAVEGSGLPSQGTVSGYWDGASPGATVVLSPDGDFNMLITTFGMGKIGFACYDPTTDTYRLLLSCNNPPPWVP